jgi:RNA polymerase sigma factor (sigma-70 family)
MATPQAGSILHHLRQMMLRIDGAGLTDGQLLRSYLHHRDEAAFEALVRRHGPMVRSVCCRVLRNPDDADDAFQAVFLVLLRKASSLEMREVLGDWLHGVAYRTALKSRSVAARRRVKERQASRDEAIVDDEPRPDWMPLLDREIARLPKKYRLPIVLCDLQGRTRKEAARQLGWPEGTLSGRLSRAREMLARRLTSRGVTLSAGILVAALTGEASACLPFALIGSTCKAASLFAVGQATGVVTTHVAALTEGVVKAMLLSKLKNVVALLTVALVLGVGASAWHVAIAEQGEKSSPQPTPAEPSAKPIPNPTTAAAPFKSDTVTPVIPAAVVYPSPARYFQIDLKIMERKDGQRKVLAEPRLLTLEGRKASFSSGEPKTIQLGGGTTEEVVVGPAISAVVRSGKEHKVHLDVMVSQPVRTIIGDTVLLETKTVRGILEIELGATARTTRNCSLRCRMSIGVPIAS